MDKTFTEHRTPVPLPKSDIENENDTRDILLTILTKRRKQNHPCVGGLPKPEQRGKIPKLRKYSRAWGYLKRQ